MRWSAASASSAAIMPPPSPRAGSTRRRWTSAWRLLKGTLELAAVKEADIVIEAVFEEMAIKKELFGKLDKLAKPGADARHQHLEPRRQRHRRRDEAAAGRHRHAFLQPGQRHAPASKIVRGARTGKDVIATTMKLAKTHGQGAGAGAACATASSATACSSNTSARPSSCSRKARCPGRSTRRCSEWGLAMGPFAMGDMAGNDVGWRIRKQQAASRPERPALFASRPIASASRVGSGRRPMPAGTATRRAAARRCPTRRSRSSSSRSRSGSASSASRSPTRRS